MPRRTAIFLFLAVCIILAVLLVTGIISSFTSGCVFAVVLVILGGFTRGFKGEVKRGETS
jgi:hypothetical protein